MNLNWNFEGRIPLSLRTDVYKLAHFTMYPEADRMFAYIEARKAFTGQDDDRMVVFGINYFKDNVLEKKLTTPDIQAAKEFLETMYLGQPYPFPYEILEQAIKEGGGYWPFEVRALADGQTCKIRTPVATIEARSIYAPLVTYLETSLERSLWYGSTVATLSRLVRDRIEKAFYKTVDPENYWKIDSRLHDFGDRGVSSMESAILGGMAHLLSFSGSDTTEAAYAAWLVNNRIPVATSIAATEHSVMTAHATELAAVLRMVDLYGGTVFATVADTKNYDKFLDMLPLVAPLVKAKGGVHIIRPDSGDPVECVLNGLRKADLAYGHTVNSKGFKVLNNCGIIQGDGIDIFVIFEILEAVQAAGYSVENVAFGMGGGLLQKVNRDTMGWAMKLSESEVDGHVKSIMKAPKTDMSKASLPGKFEVTDVWHSGVVVNNFGYELPSPRPLQAVLASESTNNHLLKIWDSGPCIQSEDFNSIRNRLTSSWPQHAGASKPWSAALTEHRNSVYGEFIKE